MTSSSNATIFFFTSIEDHLPSKNLKLVSLSYNANTIPNKFGGDNTHLIIFLCLTNCRYKDGKLYRHYY